MQAGDKVNTKLTGEPGTRVWYEIRGSDPYRDQPSCSVVMLSAPEVLRAPDFPVRSLVPWCSGAGGCRQRHWYVFKFIVLLL